MPLASDNFNRANSGNLGANWTKLSSFGDIGISGNQATGQTASDNADAYTALGNIALDHYSEVTISNAANDGGPTVRSDTSGTFYLLDCTLPANNTLTIYKCITGVFVDVCQVVGYGISATDVMRLSQSGKTLQLIKNGSLLLQSSDSSIDGSVVGGAQAGIHIFSTSLQYNFWQCDVVTPIITTQPSSQSAFEGKTATFSVAADASLSLTYQWSRNGSSIGGATSSSYTTPALTFAANNGDYYTCAVTDTNGTTTSSKAFLNVAEAPSIWMITA